MANNRGQVGTITDPTLRGLIMQLQNQIAGLQDQLTSLTNTALSQQTQFNAQGARLTGVGEPVADSDAVTLGYFKRIGQNSQVLITQVGDLTSGHVPARLVTPGVFGRALLAGASNLYTFQDNVQINQDLAVLDDLSVADDVTIGDKLDVTGVTTLTGPLVALSTMALSGDFNQNGGLVSFAHATGAAYFDGNVTAAKDLSVGDDLHVGDDCDVDGDLVVALTTTMIGNAQCNNNLGVTGTATLGTLKTGSVTGTADVPITGFIQIQDSGGSTIKLAVIA